MKRIDLHVHTTASDGTFPPAEAVSHARDLGLAAIAITDHDTPAGLPEARAAGRALGVEVVPGIEVSVDYLGRGVHVLGYFIDPAAPSLRHLLNWVVAERRRRNAAVEELFRADGGVVLKGLESGDVDGLQGLGKDIVEAPLGHAPRQRHLAAFEADPDAAAAAGLLALVAASGGLAVTGALASALALASVGGAGGRSKIM